MAKKKFIKAEKATDDKLRLVTGAKSEERKEKKAKSHTDIMNKLYGKKGK